MEAVFRSVAAAVAFLSLSLPAHAYLDPVTGSLLVQGLIALVAGLLASIRSFRLKCLAVLSSLLGRKNK